MTKAERVYDKLKSAPPEMVDEVLDFVEFLEARHGEKVRRDEGTIDRFFGVLKGSRALVGDPLEIQRRLRDEWT